MNHGVVLCSSFDGKNPSGEMVIVDTALIPQMLEPDMAKIALKHNLMVIHRDLWLKLNLQEYVDDGFLNSTYAH